MARSSHLFVNAGLHDPAEEYRTMPETQRHAGCADCHNPHAAARSAQDLDGLLPGSLKEVRAVQAHYPGEWTEPTMFASASATAEYEICFKCHSAYSYGTTPPVSPSRRAADGLSAPAQTSPALQFDPLNASMHAVVKEHPRRLEAPAGAFVGLDRTGAPWSWDSVLLCTLSWSG
jgi:formate-dependent nitrite reductase cytochrome c552 subunit